MSQVDTVLVREVLSEYSALTRTWMGRYLEPKEPRKYLYDLAAEYPLRAGRGLRPTICLANAKIFGGDEQAAVLSAVSIELLHNAMLVHDDVEDESEMRRGGPTLNEAFGASLAINAGDMLLAMAMRPLLDNTKLIGHQLALAVLSETHNVARESAEGQALELGWRFENATGLACSDYMQMVFKKTSWLTTIHPLRVGALIGSRGRCDLSGFIRLGFFMGSAFQIQDDILNLAGDAKAYGKELAGDIGEGKRTLMLIRLFNEVTPQQHRRLEDIFALPRDERLNHVDWIAELMREHNCLAYAREVAHAHAGAALHEFDKIYGHFEETREKAFIKNLIYWVIERS